MIEEHRIIYFSEFVVVLKGTNGYWRCMKFFGVNTEL